MTLFNNHVVYVPLSYLPFHCSIVSDVIYPQNAKNKVDLLQEYCCCHHFLPGLTPISQGIPGEIPQDFESRGPAMLRNGALLGGPDFSGIRVMESMMDSLMMEIMTGWWFGTFYMFPYIGKFIIPID